MIKIDFCEIESSLLNKKDEVMQQFNDSEMIGWTRKIDSSIILKSLIFCGNFSFS